MGIQSQSMSCLNRMRGSFRFSRNESWILVLILLAIALADVMAGLTYWHSYQRAKGHTAMSVNINRLQSSHRMKLLIVDGSNPVPTASSSAPRHGRAERGGLNYSRIGFQWDTDADNCYHINTGEYYAYCGVLLTTAEEPRWKYTWFNYSEGAMFRSNKISSQWALVDVPFNFVRSGTGRIVSSLTDVTACEVSTTWINENPQRNMPPQPCKRGNVQWGTDIDTGLPTVPSNLSVPRIVQCAPWRPPLDPYTHFNCNMSMSSVYYILPLLHDETPPDITDCERKVHWYYDQSSGVEATFLDPACVRSLCPRGASWRPGEMLSISSLKKVYANGTQRVELAAHTEAMAFGQLMGNYFTVDLDEVVHTYSVTYTFLMAVSATLGICHATFAALLCLVKNTRSEPYHFFWNPAFDNRLLSV